METKVCTKCHQQKDINLFDRNKQIKDGHTSRCKQCRAIDRKLYRDKVKSNKSEKSLQQIKEELYTEQFLNNGEPHGKNTYKRILIKQRGRKCQMCGCVEWLNKPINLQMHHVDGNHYNNHTSNIVLLCPNCHSYTDNYCGKNKNKNICSDQQFHDALIQCENNISKACIMLGIARTGTNYQRAYKIINDYNTMEQ